MIRITHIREDDVCQLCCIQSDSPSIYSPSFFTNNTVVQNMIFGFFLINLKTIFFLNS